MTVHSRRQSKSRMSAANASVIAWVSLGKLHFTKIPVWSKATFFIHLLDQIIFCEYGFTSGQVNTITHHTYLQVKSPPLGKDSIYFTLLTDVTVYRQAGVNFSMHFWETGAESLRFSADTCLAPWWIPLPLLRTLGGRSLSCLFPPHFPALQFEAEASAEVGLSEKKKRKRKQEIFFQLKKWVFE